MSLKFANNNSLSAITALPASISGGALTLLQTQTASSSATISFTSNIDSTYDAYMFKFYDIHPATDDTGFMFNMSIDSGSNYNVAKTTTAFNAAHKEDDTSTNLGYESTYDLAQGTGFQILDQENLSTDNDNGLAGTLHLFNPSSTTYVKHFISRCPNNASSGVWCNDTYVAGYFNTTSAIDAVQFKMGSGNIDAGDICLYGIK